MAILETLLILLTIFSTVHSTERDVCPHPTCGSFTLHYPFKLQNTQPRNNCSYTNLNCASYTTLTLPKAGEFYVRDINYLSPYIRLSDPGNCLMARLMFNLDLSSSPFTAIKYVNYTFYTCPHDWIGSSSIYLLPIRCLSNGHKTYVSALVDPLQMHGCEVNGTWALPVLYETQFESTEFDSDLYLTWDSSQCIICEYQYESSPPSQDDSNGSWVKFTRSPFFIPAFITMAIIFVICMLTATRAIADGVGNDTDPNLPIPDRQPIPTAGGMDDSKINAFTELVVFSESRTNPAGPDSNTCSICLEGYCPEEQVRSIAKCHHCFHANCIELWLRKNRTCPVCRTLLSDDDYNLS